LPAPRRDEHKFRRDLTIGFGLLLMLAILNLVTR
jgi:hypothetical protein